MKILVVEDSPIHQASAIQTLEGHEVTIAKSFGEAMQIMMWGDSKDFPFEVVLTDMMMPMSKETLVPEAFKPDEQVPYGFIVALKASLCGAKFVAMITDSNHHKGAMSAALDYLGPSYYEWIHGAEFGGSYRPHVFEINGARVVFMHAPFLGKPEFAPRRGTVKDWGRILADLTSSHTLPTGS